MNTLKNKTNASTTTISQIVVTHSSTKSGVPFLKANVVPPGDYRYRVEKIVESQIATDNRPAVDVVFRFTDKAERQYWAKLRYGREDYYFQQFHDMLIEAGLPSGSTLDKAIGVEDDVTVTYSKERAFGKIERRVPVAAPQVPATSKAKAKAKVALVEDDSIDEGDDYLDEDDDLLDDDDIEDEDND